MHGMKYSVKSGKTNRNSVNALIITWNRKELLAECLDAILCQTYSVNKIFIIDNGSTDGTHDYLGARGYLDCSKLKYIRFEENGGPAFGFNQGFLKALDSGADWLWVMDDDVIPHPDALERLVEAFSDNFDDMRSIGFLVSMALAPNGGVMNVPQPDLRLSSTGYADWNHLLHKGLVKVRKATFVSILFPMTTLEDFGVPRKEFFMWGEDIDYTMAITEQRPGYQVGTSKAVHCRSSSKPPSVEHESDPRRVQLLFFYYRNQYYLKKRYDQLPNVLNQLRLSAHAIVVSIIKRPFSFSRIQAVVSGVVAGFFFNPDPDFGKGVRRNRQDDEDDPVDLSEGLRGSNSASTLS
jgi:GT2 family glycosyltransferase